MSQASELVGVTTLFLILAWFFLGLRTYVRARIVRKFGIDDGLMAVAVALYTVFAGLVYNGVYRQGFGSTRTTGNGSKSIFFFYIFCTTVTKLSVGFLLLRICTAEHRIYRWIIWANMALSTMIWIASMPLIFLQCSPAELRAQAQAQAQGLASSSSSSPSSSCLQPSYGATGLPFSVVDIVSEWIFAVVPILILWNVKIPRRVKVSLMIILALGVFASVACVVYTVLLARAIRERNIYRMSGTLVWAQAKIGLGIVASSAATLRPFFKEIKNGRFTRTRVSDRDHDDGRSGGSGGGGGTAEKLELGSHSSNASKSAYEHGGHGDRAWDTGSGCGRVQFLGQGADGARTYVSPAYHPPKPTKTTATNKSEPAHAHVNPFAGGDEEDEQSSRASGERFGTETSSTRYSTRPEKDVDERTHKLGV